MVKLKREKKDGKKEKAINLILSRFSDGLLLVEGKHDVKTLVKLGLRSYTYNSFIKAAAEAPRQTKVFILGDRDRRGIEKSEIVANMLRDLGFEVDTESGLRLLKILNSSSVEEIYAPMVQALNLERKT